MRMRAAVLEEFGQPLVVQELDLAGMVDVVRGHSVDQRGPRARAAHRFPPQVGFAQAGFARISQEFDDVARLLGAGPATLARTIHLPLARPAIWGAALLVFVDCLKELPATLLLRPLNVETLSTYIYQFATRGSFEQGSLAALIIVAVGILPVMLITRYADIATMVGRGEN